MASICLPNELLPIVMVLRSKSNENYIVGGAVRDTLLGLNPHDFDIVTDISISEQIKMFELGGFRVKLTGVEHFVLNVSTPSGFWVEISNFRKDTSCDGRHATCEIGNMTTDANRRDFTVNSLYVNLDDLDITIDPTGLGLSDIETKTLRFVGNAKQRIREDYLRVWRAYRFISKGFVPEKNTIRAMRELFNEAYQNSNPERVRSELEKYESFA